MWKSYHTEGINEEHLYRFLCLDHLRQFLENGRIWFSRADFFADKMESVHIGELLKDKPDFPKILTRKRLLLISCWHLADQESLALWDNYTDDDSRRRKVAIRFRYKELRKLVVDKYYPNNSFYIKTKFHYGRVLYRDLVNADAGALNKSAVRLPFFRKERAFEYEKEFRFVIQYHPDSKCAPDGCGYQLGEPRKLDFDILVNPLLKKEEYEAVQQQVKRMGFASNLKPSALAKWLKPELW